VTGARHFAKQRERERSAHIRQLQAERREFLKTINYERAQANIATDGVLGVIARGYIDGYLGATRNTITTAPLEYEQGYSAGLAARKATP
jgi:hypothetical protein